MVQSESVHLNGHSVGFCAYTRIIALRFVKGVLAAIPQDKRSSLNKRALQTNHGQYVKTWGILRFLSQTTWVTTYEYLRITIALSIACLSFSTTQCQYHFSWSSSGRKANRMSKPILLGKHQCKLHEVYEKSTAGKQSSIVSFRQGQHKSGLFKLQGNE